MRLKAHLVKGRSGKYHLRLVSRNGKTTFPSENYSSKSEAQQAKSRIVGFHWIRSGKDIEE